MHILMFALKAFQVAKQLYAAGKDVKTFYDQTTAALEKMKAEDRGPTDEEWKALDDLSAELSAHIQAAKP